MTDLHTPKISTARRKGDAYELHILALHCLRMLVESEIVHVLHEYRPALPVDDVVVESLNGLDCYQAKHAIDPHALLTFEDLIGDTELRLNIQRLKAAWESLAPRGKEVRLHIFTNRAAGPELAKILERDRIASVVVENKSQKRRRSRLKAASGISDENEFKKFLGSLRFDLRQRDLGQLRQHIRHDWLERRLGLDPEEAHPRLMFNIEDWWLEPRSRPINRAEVLKALQIDSGTLPQVFYVDPRTYIPHPGFERKVDDLIASMQAGYVVIVGPPGSGKSTFIARYIQKREWQYHQPVIRYYCFTEVNDPLFRQRVSKTEFLKSMIEQLWQQFGHLLPEEGRYDYSLKKFYQLLTHLGQYFETRGKKLLMVVDGLDHAKRADIEDTKKLLNVLPGHLPQGVVCLIGTQGTHYLPHPIERDCRGERQLTLPLFDFSQTLRYLRNYSQLRSKLTPHQAERIHERSEGLPLYLHYIAEQLSTTSPDYFDVVITTLPSHGGHIDHYHGWLWDELCDDPPLRHLCGLLARLRFRVQGSHLLGMVGLDAFEGEQSLKCIRHLLDVTGAGIRIFHNSFREFVQAELTTNESRQLDIEILAYLDNRRGTPAWFAHAFEYAMAAQDYTYLVNTLSASYVEDAIAKGRPRNEIVGALRLGVEAAVDLTDPVATARIATLVSYTANRLQHHIDQRQLQRTLFALEDPDAALAAISHEGKVYDSSQTIAEALVGLAVQGHRTVGQELAKSFFDGLPRRLDTVDLISSVGELLAVYGKFPAKHLAHFIHDLRGHTGLSTQRDSSGVILLRTVLRRLYQFERWDLMRTLRRLLLAKPDGELWVEECLFQTALLEAEYRPETAKHHLRWAEQRVHDKSKRIRLAGVAARIRCNEQLVCALLAGAALLPSLQSDSVRCFSARDDFQEFRAYIEALTYCARDDELKALRDYLSDSPTWLATYYLANLDMVMARVSLACGEVFDPVKLLLPLDRLINHQKYEGERIYEVFGAVRLDLPDFLREVIEGYVAAYGDIEQLLDRLRRWGDSELISVHYGIGLAVADYSNEMAALKEAAKYPHLQTALKPLLVALHDKIRRETLETETRTNHLLQLSETAAICGYKALANGWLLEGLRASNGYGYRKDITLSILIDAAKVVNQIDPNSAVLRFADIADWNSWMHRVTDGKETEWFAHHLFDAVLEYDFQVALELLLTYRYTIGRWKFLDCLTKLVEAYEGENPQLAYVLSEAIREDGFGDKFRARHHLMRLAADRREMVTAAWIADRLRQFIQCEVSPDRRENLVRDYNQTAFKHGLPTIADLSVAQPSTLELTDGHTPTSKVVQLDGESILATELANQMSTSVEAFVRLLTELRNGNQFYDFREQVNEAARRLMHKAVSVIELDQVAEVVTKDRLSATDMHLALADAYRGLGAHARYLSQCRRAFESFHGWGLWDKRIEYLTPLIEHDPDEALEFLLQVIEQNVKKYDYGGFGTSTLLVRALNAFGDRYQEVILRIYDEFHNFVGSQFTSLPSLGESAYDWLREETIDLVTFEDAALKIVFDEWKEPTLHRRIALTHLLRDLAISQPDLLLPQLVPALEHDDQTLRVQSALVLSSVVLQQPDLLRPYVEAIANALDRPHLEVTQHLVTTLQQIAESETLPADIEARLNRLHPHVWSREVLLPPQSVKPSEHFLERVLPHVMTSVVEMVKEVCDGLGLDLDVMYWRIERQMLAMGYDKDTAEDEHRSRWRYYVHPQGLSFSVIPFETYATYFLRHAFAEVMEQITREQVMSAELLEALYRRMRSYDPCFPWRHTCPKPKDLALPHFEDPHGGAEITPEIRAWLHFEDVPEFAITGLAPQWIPIFDLYFQSHGRLRETCILMTHLVSHSLSDAITAGTSDPGKFGAVLQLAPKPPFFTMTIEEAQYLLEMSRFSENPAIAPRVPLIALHSGHWWYFETYDLAGLAGPWIKRYSLKWKSADGLDMQMGRNDAIRYIRWRDGYLTSTYQYESVGSGTRLSISPHLLQVVMSEFDLRLLVTQHMTRTVKRPRYGREGVDEEQGKEIVRLIDLN